MMMVLSVKNENYLADPVIEAIARLKFENGMRKGVLPGDCWHPYGGRTYSEIVSNFE